MASSAGSRVRPASSITDDADGQRDAEVVVDAEAGQGEGQQGDHHGGRRGGDRLAHPGHRVATASFGSLAVEQLLAHPEDEEQAVVGPRPQQQDDQQDLGEEGDLEAVGPQGADEGAGQGQDQDRRRAG